MMKQSRYLVWLSWLVALLAIFYAGMGLVWESVGSPYEFTTLRGETVMINGHGLYRYDTVLTANAFRGTDAVTLLVALPLLVVAIQLYRRGSLRGLLLLAGALSYFLYNAISLLFSAAYNSLVLVYIASFTACLFAFGLALAAVDQAQLRSRAQDRLPRRGAAAFLFFAGTATALIWLSDMLPAMARGGAPATLGSYTTIFTYGFDLAVITPATLLAGALLLRRAPLGYLLSPVLLILCTLIGVAVIGQTVFQVSAGISFSPGQFIGLIGSWILMGAAAVFLLVAFLRNISEKA
jgi:hypothetical protein